MKSFEELMGENGFEDLEEKSEEEITDEEMLARAKVFINVHESMEKEQRIFMSGLSLKLNNLFKAGCSSKQLIRAFNLKLKELWENKVVLTQGFLSETPGLKLLTFRELIQMIN